MPNSPHPSRSVAESRLTTTMLMTPEYANFTGNIHGGHLLRFVDQIAYACATRFSGEYCVTLSVDRVLFKVPVKVGDLLTMKAQVNRAGTTSLEIGVRVEAQDLHGGPVRHTNSCFVTMVATCEGQPRTVPALILETAEDRRRNAAATRRREQSRLQDHVAVHAPDAADIVDLAMVAMLIVDGEDGRIRRANGAASALLDRPRQELIDAMVWDLHPADQRQAAHELWEQTRALGYSERILVHCTPHGVCSKLRCTSWKIPLPVGDLIQRVMRPVD